MENPKSEETWYYDAFLDTAIPSNFGSPIDEVNIRNTKPLVLKYPEQITLSPEALIKEQKIIDAYLKLLGERRIQDETRLRYEKIFPLFLRETMIAVTDTLKQTDENDASPYVVPLRYQHKFHYYFHAEEIEITPKERIWEKYRKKVLDPFSENITQLLVDSSLGDYGDIAKLDLQEFQNMDEDMFKEKMSQPDFFKQMMRAKGINAQSLDEEIQSVYKEASQIYKKPHLSIRDGFLIRRVNRLVLEHVYPNCPKAKASLNFFEYGSRQMMESARIKVNPEYYYECYIKWDFNPNDFKQTSPYIRYDQLNDVKLMYQQKYTDAVVLSREYSKLNNAIKQLEDTPEICSRRETLYRSYENHLLNIPSETKLQILKASDPSKVLVIYDQKAAHLRIKAELMKQSWLLEVGVPDMHLEISKQVGLRGHDRKTIKTINTVLLVYGGGENGLAQALYDKEKFIDLHKREQMIIKRVMEKYKAKLGAFCKMPKELTELCNNYKRTWKDKWQGRDYKEWQSIIGYDDMLYKGKYPTSIANRIFSFYCQEKEQETNLRIYQKIKNAGVKFKQVSQEHDGSIIEISKSDIERLRKICREETKIDLEIYSRNTKKTISISSTSITPLQIQAILEGIC